MHFVYLKCKLLKMIEKLTAEQILKKIYYIQGQAHKVLQINSTQTIDHTQKCSRQKFQCSRRPSYWTTLFFYQRRR